MHGWYSIVSGEGGGKRAEGAPFRHLLFREMYGGVSYISRRKESSRGMVEGERQGEGYRGKIIAEGGEKEKTRGKRN
ncbi:hypothetical protein [Methanogenium sp. MK-MG]|uniref:hypothetical protein n=1 Tax=Methanogenium sp. MK-MG TaxID=2599926 RepID=UPI0013EE1848|nr:hypothetical protein [Methanogenium sp. MK-MG]